MDKLKFDITIADDERVLVDVRDFRIPLDRITLLFGESGIGKSLIARAVYGLLDPDELRVTINGEPYKAYLDRPETTEMQKNGFFVFQEPSSHLNPLMPLGIQIKEGSLAEARDEATLLSEMWNQSDTNQVENLLEVYPKPHRPSGGEKQRMFLVMALKKIDIALTRPGTAPNCFVFDEPTGNLDNRIRDIFLSLLFRRFERQPFTTLLITHDYSMVGEVIRSYRKFSHLVSFEELSLHGESLTLTDFQPETYLTWLDRERTEQARPSSQLPPAALSVESGVHVFGQELTISKDPQGTNISPLEIRPGSTSYLKAPSGTGKTTLAKLIMGLIRGNKVRVSFNRTVLTESTPQKFWRDHLWGRKMSLVFQHADEALNLRSTVAETFNGLPTLGRVTEDRVRSILSELFEDELSSEFLNKPVGTLSGGQKQKLNLLRSLSLNTEIIILDEPLNGLDLVSTGKVLSMLKTRTEAGAGILLISHNEEIFDAVIPAENHYYLNSRMLS